MGGSSGKPTQGPTAEEDKDLGASRDIELDMMRQQIEALFKFKILLLGAGESGKSTVVKQLKLLHKSKADEKEMRMIATSLHQNVVDCMKALIHAAETFKEHEFTEGELDIKRMLMRFEDGGRLEPEMAPMIKSLWHGQALQHAYSQRHRFWLLDSFAYYISHIDRFCEPGFMPTEEDQLMARVRTTGIVVTDLESKIAKQHENEPECLNFQVVDVGGQRNERKKWMHCFDDVKAVLFIVNLVGYNQVLFEDANKNRMEEEIELFKQVVNNPIFRDTPIFLFLNKKDLFETVVLETDMKCAFPDYTGGCDMRTALDYIKEAFQSQLPPGKKVDVEEVSARWKRDIKTAFEHVKHRLYDMNRQSLLEAVAKIKSDEKRLIAKRLKGQKTSSCC